MDKDQNTMISLAIPYRLTVELDEYCSEHSVNRSKLIRKLIQDHLDKHKKDK